MFRKILAIILSLCLLAGCSLSLAEDAFDEGEDGFSEEDASAEEGDSEDDDLDEFEEDDDFDEFEDDEEDDGPTYIYTGPEYDYDHLVVGNTTALSGNFTTQMWGYNTSDVDVSTLINGYNLVHWDYALGNYAIDPTVVSGITVLDDGTTTDSGLLVEDDRQGNRFFIMSLNQNLTYSDGTPITAADYAFNILLNTSPEAAALGGDTDNYAGVLGIKDYKSGAQREIAGVRIMSPYMLRITIESDHIPFFYELGLLRCYPMPIHIIAPGCEVRDDGEGAYIEGEFTSELLQKTLLDPETGYVSHPSVVSGPYKLTSFDPETYIAEFEINEYYQGNSNGIKPTIPRITLKPATNETMIAELEAGEFGLLDKCLNADAIMSGLGVVATGNYAMDNFTRFGMSFISFNCEKEVTGNQAVRQAIAYCLDKDETVSAYAGNYGLRVDGYYGIGQWMYQVLTGAIQPPIAEPDENATNQDIQEYENALAEWALLNMDEVKKYDLDMDEAVRVLEADGWNLNMNGDPFRPGVDEIRCKLVEHTIQNLELTLVYPEGNRMGEILAETLVPHLAQVGIVLHLEPMEWHQLLRQYYRLERRDCDMFYLASNFFEVFDPWPVFDPADADTGLTNYTGIRDELLYERARDLTQTEPGDTFGYEVKWIDFQKQYQEVVPAIPIYSNVYFDFFTRCLHNFVVQDDVTWTEAIVEAYMGDPGLEEETEEESEEDEWE